MRERFVIHARAAKIKLPQIGQALQNIERPPFHQRSGEIQHLQAVQSGKLGQACVGDRGQAEVEFLQTLQPRERTQPQVANLGHLDI